MAAIIKMRVMPSSLDTGLEGLGKGIKSLIEGKGGKNARFEEEPIAFGLKALVVFFIWDEEKELETLEKSIEKINGVKSLEVLDIRRAIG